MDINLALYGSVDLDEVQSEIIDTPELQRLRGIKQLGLVEKAYPDGVNTRFAHALGVSYTAGKIADHLNLDPTEKRLVQLAGLLHDIGHTPYSHTLETLLPEDHMVLTRKLVTGEEILNLPGAGDVPKILRKYGIDPITIGDLITERYHGKKYLQQIIHSEVDADQLDYLQRDTYFTGNKLGTVDLDYIINTMIIKDGRICVEEKGVTTLRSMFASRLAMYDTVYIHRVSRIAETMLLKAVKLSLEDLPDLTSYTDDELLTRLMIQASHLKSKELAQRVKYRHLFKEVYKIDSKTATTEQKETAENLADEGLDKIEQALLKETGLEEGEILTEFPADIVSEHRMTKTNIDVLKKDGSLVDLVEVSPTIKALVQEESADALFSVYCAKENAEKVLAAVEKYLLEHK